MQLALTHKGQAALWVTYGCTSNAEPITTLSAPMGVDNKILKTWAILCSVGYSSLHSDPDIIWAQFHKCNKTYNAENFVRQIHVVNGFVKLVPGDESQRKVSQFSKAVSFSIQQGSRFKN